MTSKDEILPLLLNVEDDSVLRQFTLDIMEESVKIASSILGRSPYPYWLRALTVLREMVSLGSFAYSPQPSIVREAVRSDLQGSRRDVDFLDRRRMKQVVVNAVSDTFVLVFTSSAKNGATYAVFAMSALQSVINEYLVRSENRHIRTAEGLYGWQLTHLQSLLAAHGTARSSLLSVLQQRAESVQTALPRNKEALEEALFT